MVGLTKHVRELPHRPRNGDAPLAIVEFSLTNEIRDALKAALEPYVNGSEGDKTPLKQVAQDHFPKEILAELSALSRHKGTPSTVFVIRNLPEISETELNGVAITGLPKAEHYLKNNTYTAYITQALGEALDLKSKQSFGLVRPPLALTDQIMASAPMHKHSEQVTMLGCALSNGAKTSFSDMLTMTEDARAERATVYAREKTDLFYLHTIAKALPKLFEAIELYLISPNETFDRIRQKHSLDVTLGSGDMALWANDGRIFHSAIAQGEGKRRMALSTGFNR